MNLDNFNNPFLTDGDAWSFLINEITPVGDFRIHTNKDGIRLYIEFTNRDMTGYIHDYYVIRTKSGLPNLINKGVYEEKGYIYKNTIVCPTLLDCVKYHISQMPGNIQLRCWMENQAEIGLQYKWTPRLSNTEFKIEFNKTSELKLCI